MATVAALVQQYLACMHAERNETVIFYQEMQRLKPAVSKKKYV